MIQLFILQLPEWDLEVWEEVEWEAIMGKSPTRPLLMRKAL